MVQFVLVINGYRMLNDPFLGFLSRSQMANIKPIDRPSLHRVKFNYDVGTYL